VAAYAPDAPIVTLGSASKLFWGGLRIGWLRGPVPMVAALTGAKVVADLGSPLLSQLVTARLLDHVAETRLARRELLAAGLDALSSALERELPEWEFRLPEGGASLWVRLPVPAAREFATLAARSGVAVADGPQFSATEEHADHLRLTFTQPPDVLEAGVTRLAEAWRRYRAGPPPPPIDVVLPARVSV
jgi:DNA-binding transcriptional MocR family regulator